MVFPYFGFSKLISCVLVLHSRSVIVFLSVPKYLDLCTLIHTRVNRLWPVSILTSGIRAMEDSFGGMFKLTDSNYSVWKSKMRDRLVCKDLWLAVQVGDKRPDKIDATTWEVLHLKASLSVMN